MGWERREEYREGRCIDWESKCRGWEGKVTGGGGLETCSASTDSVDQYLTST